MKLCDGEANADVNRKRNREANGVGSHVESHEGCLVKSHRGRLGAMKGVW
jgi:hypothetical protein